MHPCQNYLSIVLFITALPVTSLCAQTSHHSISDDQSFIRFDMPPTAPAVFTETSSTDSLHHTSLHNTSVVTCNFPLSSLIASPATPRIDQWLVTFQPRDAQVAIADYAPRTDLGSDIDGPIQVKSINEKTKSLGISLDGDYSKVIGGSAAADGSQKSTDSEQYNRVAPIQAITASGSINRGRGVYFKMRWTAQQVLEGEKTFQLTLDVPEHWRGSLIDISVTAQSQHHGFGGWDKQIKTLGKAHFVVATFPAGDKDAAARARRVALAEQALRDSAANFPTKQSAKSLPGMIRHIAAKLDLDSPRPNNRWMQRLIRGEADPYMDREISRLPIEVRVAAIDYHDARNKFAQLTGDAS